MSFCGDFRAKRVFEHAPICTHLFFRFFASIKFWAYHQMQHCVYKGANRVDFARLLNLTLFRVKNGRWKRWSYPFCDYSPLRYDDLTKWSILLQIAHFGRFWGEISAQMTVDCATMTQNWSPERFERLVLALGCRGSFQSVQRCADGHLQIPPLLSFAGEDDSFPHFWPWKKVFHNF